MKTGEHWYAMLDPQGAPQGYARLVVTDREGGAQHVAWELHLAFPGGTYEEERTAVFEGDGRLLALSYVDGSTEVRARREGDRLVGVRRDASGEQRLEVPVADDATCGMGFVLVAGLPFEAGFERAHDDHNEAQGLKPEGRCTLEMVGPETVELPSGPVETWKGGLVRADGRRLPIWVDRERRIVQTDWGGGNLMVWSEAPTQHLFQPAPPVVHQLEKEDLTSLVVEGTFDAVDPATLFGWWTEPRRLQQWWPEEAAVGRGLGGPYVLSWPTMGWTLRGQITAWERGRRLAFTWAWDHMPEKPELAVDVTFGPAEGGVGTRLRLVQGPYRSTDEDRRERDGHWQGWQSVCARLEAVLPRP